MPRMRTLKVEFWEHPNPPSFEARLLYMAMWNWANDDGIGTANPKLLAGFAFPYDDEIDSLRTQCLFSEVSLSYDVRFYSVGGRAFYVIDSFKQHQHPNRPTPGTLPTPDQAEKWLYQHECEDSVSPHGALSEPLSEPSHAVVSSKELVVSNQSGTERTKRYESNAHASNGERPLDRMGRPAMSFNAMLGVPEQTPEPPPVDRCIPPEAAAMVKDVAGSLPRQVRERLRVEVGDMFNDGMDHAQVKRGFDRLMQRLADGEDVYPGHLRQCVAQVVAEETITPEQRRNGRSPTRKESKLAKLDAMRENPRLQATPTRKEISNDDEPG